MTALPVPIVGLLETLNLLLEQARAYERALPADDFRARAAVAALSRLAERARDEAISLAEADDPSSPMGKAQHPFSRREFQVLLLAMDGLTNKEIGSQLGISERTVQFHLNSVFNKTGTNSRTEAVALALLNGWLSGKS